MSVKRDADIEKSLEYPTYGYVIIDTRNLSVLAGSLTRDYFFGIKFLSDIVDKTGNTFVRLVPLIKEEYEFMTRDNNE